VVDPILGAQIAELLDTHFRQIVDEKPGPRIIVILLSIFVLTLAYQPIEGFLPAHEAVPGLPFECRRGGYIEGRARLLSRGIGILQGKAGARKLVLLHEARGGLIALSGRALACGRRMRGLAPELYLLHRFSRMVLGRAPSPEGRFDRRRFERGGFSLGDSVEERILLIGILRGGFGFSFFHLILLLAFRNSSFSDISHQNSVLERISDMPDYMPGRSFIVSVIVYGFMQAVNSGIGKSGAGKGTCTVFLFGKAALKAAVFTIISAPRSVNHRSRDHGF
jgi:hypothetical protein